MFAARSLVRNWRFVLVECWLVAAWYYGIDAVSVWCYYAKVRVARFAPGDWAWDDIVSGRGDNVDFWLWVWFGLFLFLVVHVVPRHVWRSTPSPTEPGTDQGSRNSGR